MSDSVVNTTVFGGTKRHVVHLSNISDGTGESAVVKVDVSTLTGPDGSAPTSVVVEKLEYETSGMDVRLYWDATTNDLIVALGTDREGTKDWSKAGGRVDPKSTGTTGDIVLTTVGHTSGDYYDITLWCRLKD